MRNAPNEPSFSQDLHNLTGNGGQFFGNTSNTDVKMAENQIAGTNLAPNRQENESSPNEPSSQNGRASRSGPGDRDDTAPGRCSIHSSTRRPVARESG
jgi:hypothetical protein